jgi:hypothetical protein
MRMDAERVLTILCRRRMEPTLLSQSSGENSWHNGGAAQGSPSGLRMRAVEAQE